jgi:septal ring factor EnvC (AmiA/AmiB activator)
LKNSSKNNTCEAESGQRDLNLKIKTLKQKEKEILKLEGKCENLADNLRKCKADISNLRKEKKKLENQKSVQKKKSSSNTKPAVIKTSTKS